MQRGLLKMVKDRHGVKVWRFQWRESGRGRTRILGRSADMTRAEARAEADKIVEPLNTRSATTNAPGAVTLGRFGQTNTWLPKAGSGRRPRARPLSRSSRPTLSLS